MAAKKTLNRLKAGDFLPLLLCKQDAADYLGVSASTLDKWVNDGTFPKPHRPGYWSRIELENFTLKSIGFSDDEIVERTYSSFQKKLAQ